MVMLKNLQQLHLKLLQEANCDLIEYKIANKIIKVSKNSHENDSEKVTNQHDKEIPKGKDVSPEERQEIIDELRLKGIIMEYQKVLKVSKNSQQYDSETVTND